MRTPMLALLCLALSAAGAAAQQQLDHRRPLRADGLVRIHNLVGSTRVIGWDRDSIAVTGMVAKGGRFFAGGDAGGVKLGVERGLPEASAPLDDSDPAPAHLEVRVPAGARVWVHAASATVEVSGVTGGIDVVTVTGRIRITGAPREAIAESMAGDIVIAAAAPTTVRAKSAAGAVALSGGARSASVTTVTGDITVSNGVYERGLFESIDGAIRFEGDLALAGELEFINHAGPVELRLPADVSADFLVNTFRGEVENAFGSYPMRTGPDMRGELTFSRGSGGANVVIRTFKGRVSLKER
ncbi:MAG TPA: DUF4097 family beta strand repeat-containing protein [Longimicrobiales bacterium]